MTPSPDLSNASDQELVAQAREGSEEAYRELHRRYRGPVYNLILRMVGERDLADELTQDTFVNMFIGLGTYRPEFKFSPWILKIAKNATVNHVKRGRRFKRKRLDTVGMEVTPDPRWARQMAAAGNPLAIHIHSDPTPLPASTRAELEQALARLKEAARQCIILRDIEGRSYDYIADVLGIPEGTVGSHIHRARKELRAALGHMYDALRRRLAATTT